MLGKVNSLVQFFAYDVQIILYLISVWYIIIFGYLELINIEYFQKYR